MVTIETQKGSLYVDGKFSYTRQNADVSDVSKSNTNYTNSFNVRRDKNSTRILKGLGLVGSASIIPYKKVNAGLNVNGVSIVGNGWLNVQYTTQDKYKLAILDGNIDFWKELSKYNLSDCDLHETTHEKTPQVVADSFENDYYRYFLADYNGEVNLETNEYNTDHQIPAIRESYVFDRLFQLLGFSYSLPISIDTWLTYGKKSKTEPTFGEPTTLRLDSDQVTSGRFPIKDNGYFDAPVQPVDMNGATYVPDVGQGAKIYNLETGNYKISFSWEELKAKFSGTFNVSGFTTVIVEFYINQTLYHKNLLSETDISNGEIAGHITAVELNPFDIVSVKIRPLSSHEFSQVTGFPNDFNFNYEYLEAKEFSFEMNKVEDNQIDFSDSLTKVSAKDYIKYIMHRYGLTLFYEDGTAYFKTIDQRLDAQTWDLSQYYLGRKKESYLSGNYGQHNLFKHKYTQEGQNFNDGMFEIQNEHIVKEKEIVKGLTYSPTKYGVFPMFDKEPNKDDQGGIEIKYKPIDDRSFLIRPDYVHIDEGLLHSTDVPGAQDVTLNSTNIPMATVEGATFSYFVRKYWKRIGDILNKTKIHTVEFRMSIYVFLNLDLKKKIYIKQEASYYLINSIKLKGDDKVEAELIKVN
jgi:hypothetical protein